MADTDQETQDGPQEAQAGPQDAAEDNSGTELPPNEESPAKTESDSESFSREYVEQLRAEAKVARLRVAELTEVEKRADWLETEVRRYAIKEAATAAGLVDPEALAWDDAWTTEDGTPDHDAIRAAAQKLIKDRPYLARPRGPLPGQGQHSDAESGLSLSALLRA